ncbi:hypothetical protein [Syntrophorhabdus aromaticivorans]|uniref:Uncharacterized protein n=1 Tax=Syntrophorhabdus aromaticivorans TaxID=328301 RepID=A0A971S1T5_9BACT|nr:hypothetical protein [Syntrophorhabdus aromaticivorans]NLW35869.1 hypothetical protein [Syntrophorhabdus aromaticivorans]
MKNVPLPWSFILAMRLLHRPPPELPSQLASDNICGKDSKEASRRAGTNKHEYDGEYLSNRLRSADSTMSLRYTLL